jgi:hypothetical protein
MRIVESHINKIAEYLLRKAEGDYQYVHDPEHRNKPHGNFWETEKGWSNDPKDAPNNKQVGQQNTSYPYELTPADNSYFDAIRQGNMEAVQSMVDKFAKASGYNLSDKFRSEGDYDNNFNVFDKDKIVKQSFGYGFYFSDDKDFVSENYGKNVRRFSLMVEKPFSGDTKELLDVLQKGGVRLSAQERPYYERKTVRSIFQEFDPYTVTNILKKSGYDGVYQMGETVAFEPYQIKLADPIVKDDSGNIIPLSKRFDYTSNDIRV